MPIMSNSPEVEGYATQRCAGVRGRVRNPLYSEVPIEHDWMRRALRY